MTTNQGVKGQTNPVQLSAVTPGAGLVTLTIGGNDVFFSDVVASCGAGAGCWDNHYLQLASGRRLTLGEFASLRLALVEPDITNTFGAIRSAGGAETTVMAAGFPSLFGEGVQGVSFLPGGRRTCGELAVFSKGERTKLNTASEKFDVRIARAARVAGVHYESVIDEFKGQRVCEGGDPTDEFLNGFNFTDARNFFADQGAFHPNRFGVAAYAEAVSEYLGDHAGTDPLTVWGLPANPEPQRDQANRSFQANSVPGVEMQVQAAIRAQVVGETPEAQAVLDEVAADDQLLASFSDAERAELARATMTTVALSLPESTLACRAGTVPGSRVPWSGSGFAPGSTVAVTLAVDGVPRSLGNVIAGPSGDAAAEFVVPAPEAGFGGREVLEGGLSAVGVNGASGHHSSSAVFLVDNPDEPCGKLFTAARVDDPTPVPETPTEVAGPRIATTDGSPAGSPSLLSRTGADLALGVAVAIVLVAIGWCLILAGRRRRPRRL